MATMLKKVEAWPVTFGGETHRGWLPPEATPPQPTPIESELLDVTISHEAGGYLLIWSARPSPTSSELRPPKAGDTWHESIDDAEEAAFRYFGITHQNWRDATEKT